MHAKYGYRTRAGVKLLIPVDEGHLDAITEAFHHLLTGCRPAPIPIPDEIGDNEVRQVLTYVNRFLAEYVEVADALHQVSEGDLEAASPRGRTRAAMALKALQSNLRHLTFKTQRIASGRLEERVDFMGEFSKAFNSMTQQLKDSFEAIEQRNEELRVANEVIQEEKEKSEKLLLNILPAQVAEELKQHGHSEPTSFDAVTVCFSDVVGFTKLASDMHPHDLIAELNAMFTRFDEIMEAHGCERIKSIGDAYLAVCGMPEPNPDHARTMLAATVEMLAYMTERHRDHGGWEIRIGLHSGRLVGGIVGTKKYIYDVFGDTINTASRMETCSEPMRINVSETTRDLVGDDYAFIARDPIEVKGKGAMRMYFVDV